MALVKWDPWRENEDKGKKFHRIERFYVSFSRSFKLPDNVDVQIIEAEFKAGMLHLNLPKTKIPNQTHSR